MKWTLIVTTLAFSSLPGQAADMTLAPGDIGLNAYLPKELDGCFRERPKDLPCLDIETVMGWVKAGVKLEPDQLKKVEAMKSRLRVRVESFKRFVVALRSYSDKMAQVKNEREQKRLQDEAKELNDRFRKEFPSSTANIAYNPLGSV